MKPLTILSLVLLVLTTLFGGCAKGSESTTTTDSEKPTASKKKVEKRDESSTASSAAGATSSSATTKTLDESTQTGDGHAPIRDLKVGDTILCMETSMGRTSQHKIKRFGDGDWVEATGYGEYDRGLAGPYWLKLGQYPCNIIGVLGR